MTNTQKRILVVDDDEMLREMHTSVFEDEDYLVDSAADGLEALLLLSEQHYDLLATDLFMPELNGIELIIKCQKEYPELKTLLLSGGGKDLEAEHGKKLVTYLGQEIEVGLFLKKPFDLEEMLNYVKNLLQE